MRYELLNIKKKKKKKKKREREKDSQEYKRIDGLKRVYRIILFNKKGLLEVSHTFKYFYSLWILSFPPAKSR